MKDILDAARPLIDLAVAKDIGPGDATSESTLPADLTLHGRIVAKAKGVIAGFGEASLDRSANRAGGV